MSGREPGRKTEETGHDHVRERLSDYLDGQLLGKERQAVEEHLAACSSCRWDLQTLRQTVLWTRNLPTMPVPRSFTLPVPAGAPARAARPRWRLVPAFQLATALVAVLLFFAVAGDLTLTNMRPASMPAPAIRQEAAENVVETVVVEAEVTEEASLLQAVPAEPAPETAMEKSAEPAPGARVLPTEVPLVEEAPMAAAAAPELTATPDDLAARQTAAPPGMGGGVADLTPTPIPPREGELGATTETPAPERASDSVPLTPTAAAAEVPVTPEVAEPAGEAEATLEMETMAQAEPGPTLAPQATAAPVAPEPLATPAPPLVPGEESLSGPTAQVEVEESVEALAAEEPAAADVEERALEQADDGGALVAEAPTWLRLVEYVLAALLLLLLGTTAALMVWRRRAR